MRGVLQPRREGGAVAVLVALVMLFVLIGIVGLVIDLGRLFINTTELQNAADACALAAARELNVASKTPEVLERAENAGITVGNRHWHDFQLSAVTFARDHDVTFSETLNGNYLPKGDAPTTTQYVRCTRRLAGFAQWFPQLIWLGGSTTVSPVGATAVAWMGGGSRVCSIPLGMCMKKSPDPCTVPGAKPDKFGLCKGQWYDGRFAPGSSATGNFNWIDFTPNKGGASELADAFSGPGLCDVAQQGGDWVHAQPGAVTAIKAGWNSRFGLYGPGGLDAASATPDRAGYSYGPKNWPRGYDAYGDFVDRQKRFESFGYPTDTTAAGVDLTGLQVQKSFKTSTSGESGVHGHGSDRRLVTMPIVDCTSWDSTHQVVLQGWACALMVTPAHKRDPQSAADDDYVLEYRGEAGTEGVPCGTYGLGGGSGPPVPTLVK